MRITVGYGGPARAVARRGSCDAPTLPGPDTRLPSALLGPEVNHVDRRAGRGAATGLPVTRIHHG